MNNLQQNIFIFICKYASNDGKLLSIDADCLKWIIYFKHHTAPHYHLFKVPVMIGRMLIISGSYKYLLGGTCTRVYVFMDCLWYVFADGSICVHTQ